MRVVVCGAGAIGLATALLLAGDGHDVMVLEQDDGVPPADPSRAWDGWQRPGVAQWRQPHNLFPRFQQILDAELPEVSKALVDGGCTWADSLGAPPPALQGLQRRPGDERFRFLTGRRPVAEAAFAAVAAEHPGVDIRRGAGVVGLMTHDEGAPPVSVVGVLTADGVEHRADVVVDAMGRKSPVPAWLTRLGATPQVESQDRGYVYYTKYFRGTLPGRKAPGLVALGSFSILTIQGDADFWSITLFATAHDRLFKQVRHSDRFDALVRACPLHAHWLDGEQVCGVLPMAGVLDRHRRYVVDGHPVVTGVVAVGDAWACTNPSAGRGLSVGLVHAQLLRDVLHQVRAVDVDVVRQWDAETERVVAPFFRNQQRADRIRIAEMEAARDDLPPPEPDPTMARLWAAAMVDEDAFRGLLDTVTCLALPEQVVARPAVRHAMERAGDATPPGVPGPSRRELVDLLA